jgi:hypothetical protein
MDAGEKLALPRGAVAVVVAGLILSAATALLTIDEDEGGERLEWEQSAEIADSEPVDLGPDGRLQIRDAGIESTRANASGYRLFRIAASLDLDPGSYDGASQARCTVTPAPRSVLARTPGKRAAYPLPSEDLVTQSVPELSVVRFNAKGTDLVGVDVGDAVAQFTETDAVVVEWGRYRQGEQTWVWDLPPLGDQPERLGFVTMWRTTQDPAAEIACVAETGPSRARASTAGRLG